MSAKPRSTRNNTAKRQPAKTTSSKNGSARVGASKTESSKTSSKASSKTSGVLGADILGFSARVADVLKSASHPLTVGQLTEQLRSFYPREKDLASLLEKSINQLYQAVRMPSGQIGWLGHLLNGSRIRHPLTADEAERGFLLLDELEHAALFPEFFQSHRSTNRTIQVDLFGGPTISAEAYIESKTWSLSLGTEFVHWLDYQGGQEGDDIIVMVNDAQAGHYTLRLHPREARDSNLIHNRNIHLALLAEEIVRAHVQEQGGKEQGSRDQSVLPTWQLAALLVAHSVYAVDVPPDDLHCVLHQYSLLKYIGSGYTADGSGKDVDRTRQLAQKGHPVDTVRKQKSSNAVLDVPAADKVTATEQSHDHQDGDEVADAAWESDQYQDYLDRLYESGSSQMPLTPNEFALLLGELEALTELEAQYGTLLDEQQQRLRELYTGMFMEPESWDDDFDLWDNDDTFFDSSDLENPFA